MRPLLLLVFLAFASAAHADALALPNATLHVDLTDAPRGLFHATETIQTTGDGALTLVLPRWIPGEHGPAGPIGDLVGLTFEAGGRTLPWRRDPVELDAFTVNVPSGVSELTARFDYASAGSNGNYVDGPCSTPNLAILSWNHVLLVPKGARQDAFRLEPSVTTPAGWTFGTSLESARTDGVTTTFETVTAERLVDSPLTCGRYTRTIRLAPELHERHEAFLVSDSERGLDAPASLIEKWSNVVREARAVFGTPRYRHYTFLVTLSDAISHFGLEHHESSDNRMAERALITGSGRTANALLLTHEFVHSWNGKYRRPLSMNPQDFQQPLTTDLLWVYEGLAEYYGWVLGARAGTIDAEEARDDLARTAASQGSRAGRKWRPLVDTAIAASLLNTAPGAWSSYRRGQDYYGEGQLLWLEVDALMRARSHGRKSLDDFTRAFFGIAPGPGLVVPYTRAEVVQALNGVQPYEWERFFAQRVDSVRTETPVAGIEEAGWSLAWRDSSSDYFDALDEDAESNDYRWSLGFRVGDGGRLTDVIPDSPAARAGLSPGAKLLAIEGREFSNTVLKDALLATRPAGADSSKGPSGRSGLDVVSSSDGFVRVSRIEYAGGPRYPVLKRKPGTADLLARITARKRK